MLNTYEARESAKLLADDPYKGLEETIKTLDGYWNPLTYHDMWSQCRFCGGQPCLQKRFKYVVERFVYQKWGHKEGDFPVACATEEIAWPRKISILKLTSRLIYGPDACVPFVGNQPYCIVNKAHSLYYA